MLFLEKFQSELIITGSVLIFLLIVRFSTNFAITKIARKSGINEARIRLIRRYVTVTLVLIAILIEPFVFGTNLEKIALIFSSVFAVLGVGLFAVWSILSNVTSGIIMFP